MSKQYDFWIDFKNKKIYRKKGQIPKEIRNNFIEAEPEFQEQVLCEKIVYCSSMNDFQHYVTDYPHCAVTVDWKRHRWTNDDTMLLSRLPIDELFNLLKEKNKTSLDFIHNIWRGLFDEECMDETVDILLGDDLSDSYAEDIEE